jgi:hypothetical protein
LIRLYFNFVTIVVHFLKARFFLLKNDKNMTEAIELS